MTTAAENERLAALETEVAHVKSDVTEIKTDVKTLISNQNQIAIALATKDAVEAATARSRNQTGVWVRFFSERIIALAALSAAVAALLKG